MTVTEQGKRPMYQPVRGLSWASGQSVKRGAAFITSLTLIWILLMAFSVKAGTFQKSTNTSVPHDQSISSLGFQPKAIIFFWTDDDATAVDAFNAGCAVGIGVTTGASESFCACSFLDDNVVTTNVGRIYIAKAIATLTNGTPTSGSQADLKTFDADGFTLTWTLNTANAARIGYIAFGGSDLTNAKAVNHANIAATGNQSFTGAGFQPDCAFFLGAALNSLTSGAGAALNFGCAKSSTEQWAIGISAADAITMEASQNQNRYQRTDSCIALAQNDAEAFRGVFVAFTSDGCTINQITSGLGRTIALYLKGGNYAVGSFNKTTNAASVDQSVGSLGFQPSGVLLAANERASSTSVGVDVNVSIGAASASTEEASLWAGSTDAIEPTQADNRISNTTAITISAATPTLKSQADLKQMDSGGFTLTWTTNDTATASQILYAAFGLAVAPYVFPVSTQMQQLLAQ
jgi:hypothetical protein